MIQIKPKMNGGKSTWIETVLEKQGQQTLPINISGMGEMSRVVWSDCVCIHQKSMQSFNPNVQSLWGTLAVLPTCKTLSPAAITAQFINYLVVIVTAQ